MLLKHIYKYTLSFVFVFLVFACETKRESEINAENLSEKLTQSIYEFENEGIYDTALDVLAFLEKSKYNVTDPCDKVKVVYLKIAKSIRLKQFNYGVKISRQNQHIIENCSDPLTKAFIYTLMGVTQKDRTKLDEVLQLNDRAKDLFIEAGKEKYLIDIYHNSAIIYRIGKQYEKAIESAKKSLEIINKTNYSKSTYGSLYMIIARSYRKLNKPDLVKENLIKGIQASKEFIDNNKDFYNITNVYESLAFLNNHYGVFYRNKKDYKNAYKYQRRSDSIIYHRNRLENVKKEKIYLKETQLEEELLLQKEQIIKNRQILIWVVGVFLLISLAFLSRLLFLRKKLKENIIAKESYNKQLKTSLVDLKQSNQDLSAKKEEVEKLLKQNEQSLFSKTLKISTYKDAIENIMSSNLKMIKDKKTIDASQILFLNRSLEGILLEEEIWEDFKIEFEKNKPDFFKKLLEINPALSVTEQKHCAYVAINLRSKEVASILNLSPRSVETTRYRIKKKLNLKDISLLDFLKTL